MMKAPPSDHGSYRVQVFFPNNDYDSHVPAQLAPVVVNDEHPGLSISSPILQQKQPRVRLS